MTRLPPLTTSKERTVSDDDKNENKQNDKPDTKAPEKKEPEVVEFATARYPSIQIQVPGKDLRKGIKFVDGKYATSKAHEIEILDGLEYIERVGG